MRFAVLCKTAGAGEETQPAMVPPALDVALVHVIQRTDELHARVARAVQFGRHALHLPAVQYAHQDGLDRVVEVVPERDFIAAELFRLLVQVPAPHARAEVARVLFHPFDGGEDVRFKDVQRHAEFFRVLFQKPPVFGRVAGIHGQKVQPETEFSVLFQLLHALGKQHRILPARQADGDAVPLFDQLVFAHRAHETAPQLLAVRRDERALGALLYRAHSFAHAGRAGNRTPVRSSHARTAAAVQAPAPFSARSKAMSGAPARMRSAISFAPRTMK